MCDCTKKEHPTRADAVRQARADTLRDRWLRERFVYRCPTSGSWHVTRQPQTREEAEQLMAYLRRMA